MVRRSTRNSAKTPPETKIEKKRSTRQSKRRKRSTSKSENSDDEPIANIKLIPDSTLTDSKESAVVTEDQTKTQSDEISNKNDTIENEPIKDNEGHVEVNKSTKEEEDEVEEQGKSKGKILSNNEVESDIKMNSDISDKPEQTSSKDCTENDDVNGKEESLLPPSLEKNETVNECKNEISEENDADKQSVDKSDQQKSDDIVNEVANKSEVSQKDISECEEKVQENVIQTEEKDPENLNKSNETNYEKETKETVHENLGEVKIHENINEAEEKKKNHEVKEFKPEENEPKNEENEPETEEGEIFEPDEEKVVEPLVIKLRRESLFEEINTFEDKEKSKTKKKWNLTADLPTDLFKIHTTDFLNVCPELKLSDEEELKLEETPRRLSTVTDELHMSVDGEEFEDLIKPAEEATNVIALNRKISLVEEGAATEERRAPSPAANPVSNILYITNLVRPFTIKQLRELLERTGMIKDDGFWTDKIKSKCYVEYESAQEAEATRNALHGIHWPVGNGKKLAIEYSTLEEMETARNPPAPVPIVTEPLPAPSPPREKTPLKENREPLRERRYEEHELRERQEREKKTREWDIGNEKRSRSRSRSHGRRRRHSDKRSPTPMEAFISRKQKKLEESVPQKMMDDLFQKTKAAPSIYWQPLSPEEIATKQRQRQMRMEEHKRRLEENSRNRVRSPGRGAYRRR